MGILLTLIGAMTLGVLTQDLSEWITWLARKLARVAASTAPEHLRERLAEEWASDLEDTPGSIVKFFRAQGFFVASIRLNHQDTSAIAFTQRFRSLAFKVANLRVPPFQQSLLGHWVTRLIAFMSFGRIQYDSAAEIVTWVSSGRGSWVGNLLFILYLGLWFSPYLSLLLKLWFLFGIFILSNCFVDWLAQRRKN